MEIVWDSKSCSNQFVWRTYLQYLQSTDETEGNERRLCPFEATISSNIDNCFDCEINKDQLVKYLKQLSESGFTPLKKRNDAVAEVLSRHNVAGVVMKSSLIVGLPKSVWRDGCKYGLVLLVNLQDY